MDKYNWLCAKDAIFRILADYCIPKKGEDGQYYIPHCFTSTLERAFQVLGIEQDKIPLMDFCQMWVINNRELWEYWNPATYPYYGATAQMYYNSIVKNYLAWVDGAEEE